jgi:hypothetical protein
VGEVQKVMLEYLAKLKERLAGQLVNFEKEMDEAVKLRIGILNKTKAVIRREVVQTNLERDPGENPAAVPFLLTLQVLEHLFSLIHEHSFESSGRGN